MSKKDTAAIDTRARERVDAVDRRLTARLRGRDARTDQLLTYAQNLEARLAALESRVQAIESARTVAQSVAAGARVTDWNGATIPKGGSAYNPANSKVRRKKACS